MIKKETRFYPGILMAFTALFDACVLYPAPMRDFLLQLASTGCFRARWTNEIHDEWMRNLLKARQDLTHEQLQRTRELMDRTVPDCIVSGYEKITETLELPDKGDRHVLAAAIVGRADVIVTCNIKHFPPQTLGQFGIHAQHPDEFLEHLASLMPGNVLLAAKKCRERLKNPAHTPEEYLASLARQQLPAVVSFLRQNDGLF